MKLCHWCSSSNLSVISDTLLVRGCWYCHRWEAMEPWPLWSGQQYWRLGRVSLKVRLCSPLQLGNTSCRCVVRLPPTPSSSTSQNPSCTNLFGELLYIFLFHILIMFMCRIFHGNIYAWRNLPGSLRGGVGWGLGTLFAGQGDNILPWVHKNNARHSYNWTITPNRRFNATLDCEIF